MKGQNQVNKNLSKRHTSDPSNLFLDSENGSKAESNMERASFIIHKLSTHYFFTEHNADLRGFLADTQLDMRITTGDWNKPICRSEVKPLQHFELKPSNVREPHLQKI